MLRLIMTNQCPKLMLAGSQHSTALESTAAAGKWVDEQPRYTNTAQRFEITDRRTIGLSQVLLILARTGRMSAERSGLGDRAAAAVLPPLSLCSVAVDQKPCYFYRKKLFLFFYFIEDAKLD